MDTLFADTSFFVAYHNSKEWSFTDCTSYVLMKKLNIKTGVSFDRHFRQFSIRVIP